MGQAKLFMRTASQSAAVPPEPATWIPPLPSTPAAFFTTMSLKPAYSTATGRTAVFMTACFLTTIRLNRRRSTGMPLSHSSTAYFARTGKTGPSAHLTQAGFSCRTARLSAAEASSAFWMKREASSIWKTVWSASKKNICFLFRTMQTVFPCGTTVTSQHREFSSGAKRQVNSSPATPEVRGSPYRIPGGTAFLQRSPGHPANSGEPVCQLRYGSGSNSTKTHPPQHPASLYRLP